MKITKLHLRDFQQFKDLTLDFTHPLTGAPLDRVCFIGRNGTGKTTILEKLNYILNYTLINKSYLIGSHSSSIERYKNVKVQAQFSDRYNTIDFNVFSDSLGFIVNQEELAHSFIYSNQKKINSLSYIKGETGTFDNDHPSSTLNKALKLFDQFPITNEISNSTINSFWQKLIYHIKKRENDRSKFENAEENLNKTKRELIEEFNTNEPNILEELAELWNNILDKGNLYFDYKNANNPIQLTDNLTAYIKTKSTNETIPYNKLSTGIRNFIFQLGHLKAIHFNRKIDNSFLLVDEPSQGLFPDFVYDLVELYESVVSPNTQIFMATHNPIIAAQFQPFERFILDFNDAGYVEVKRGVSPIGDDPNDLLHDDFLVKNLMPKQGIEAWERYKNLKRQIHFLSQKQPQNGEREKLNDLIKEMSELGSKYHF